MPSTPFSAKPEPSPRPEPSRTPQLSPRPGLTSKPQTEITVVGVVEAGVEHGCTMLRTADTLYQLVGSADARIKPGARLAVRGRPNPNLITTCQQGIPFQVVDVRAAD
jgi:hypothetical protein